MPCSAFFVAVLPFFVAVLARPADPPGGDRDMEMGMNMGICKNIPREKKRDIAPSLLTDHLSMEHVSLSPVGIMGCPDGPAGAGDGTPGLTESHLLVALLPLPFSHPLVFLIPVSILRNELHRPRLIFPS